MQLLLTCCVCSFFSQTEYLMREDDSLFCISAWNDFVSLTCEVKRFYYIRTSVLCGMNIIHVSVTCAHRNTCTTTYTQHTGTHVQTHTHRHIRTDIHVHNTHIHMQTHAHTRIRTYVHTDMHIQTHAHTHTYVRTHTDMHVQTYAHTYTYIRMCTHMHTHKYTNT